MKNWFSFYYAPSGKHKEPELELVLFSFMIWFFVDCGDWWCRLGQKNKWYYSYSPAQGFTYYNYKTKEFKWLFI